MVIVLNLFIPLKSQNSFNRSSSQYLFPDFTIGNVKMKNNKRQTYNLNYNTVSGKMVYEQNGKRYDIVNLTMIDSIYLQNSRFVQVKDVFYEVLLIAPISLFVQYNGKLLPAGTQAGYGGTSQLSSTTRLTSFQSSSGTLNMELPADYIIKVDDIYWIRKDSNMMSFQSERQFLKIFPLKEEELKHFIKQNSIKFYEQSNLTKLVEFCNTLYQ
jgi:hypothetical protein